MFSFKKYRVAEVRKRELEKTKRIKSIIDFSYKGVITVDQKGVKAWESMNCN